MGRTQKPINHKSPYLPGSLPTAAATLLLAVLFAAAVQPGNGALAAAPSRPNIVFILAGDKY